MKQVQCISYARFSSMGQAEGRSISRQEDLVQAYLQKNPECVLMSKLSDEGLSGYHGDHIKTGQLGHLLELVNTGEIPQGTRLLVEQPDRLSRQTALEGLDTVRKLVMSGLTIVTLDDGAHISMDSLSSDMGQLIMLMVRLSRAHEESKVKSDRAKDVWAAKRVLLKEGKLPPMRVPWWVSKPERQQLLKQIFGLALEGNGSHAIAKYLNERGIPAPSGKKIWYTPNVSNLLRDSKVTGYYTDPIDQTMHKVYPELITQSEFNKIQDMLRSRYKTIGMGIKWTSVLKRVAFCGHCGETLKPIKSKSGRTMYCRSATIGSCPNKKGLSYRTIVLGVMVAMQQDMAQMSSESTQTASSAETRAKLQIELEHAQKSIERLSAALAELDDMSEVIAQLKTWKDRRSAISQELASLDDEYEDDQFVRYIDLFYDELPDKIGGHLLNDEVHQDINVLLCKLGVRVELLNGKAYVKTPGGLVYLIEYVSWQRSRVSMVNGDRVREVGFIWKDAGDGTQYLGGNYWYLRTV